MTATFTFLGMRKSAMSCIGHRWARQAATVAMFGLALGVSGCGLLDASDPTQIDEDELHNASGAQLLRVAAIGYMQGAVGVTAGTVGLFTDEYRYDASSGELIQPTPGPDLALDRRESLLYEPASGNSNAPYYQWQTARRAIMAALPSVRAYLVEPARSAYVGQLLAARGFAVLHFAENSCPGFPLNTLVDGEVIKSGPVSTEEAFTQALADFDSAITAAADSARIADWARVGKARALLGLGRFAEAGAAVTGIETPYRYLAQYTATGTMQYNGAYQFFDAGFGNRTVAENEAGVGLNFVSAHDPRVPTAASGPGRYNGDSIYTFLTYASNTSPIVMASGIEARLIEAEVAFNAGGNWLGVLNDLRDDAISPPMPHLTDPGTDAARVDMIFRERAFWLFGTARRLADLRRLVAHYGRDPLSVFPAAPYVPSGAYNTATSLSFPREIEQNDDPRITGCTSR